MRLLLLALLTPSLAYAQASWTAPSAPPCEPVAELYALAADGFASLEAETMSSARDAEREVIVRTPLVNPLGGTDVRLVYESMGGDLSNDYSVTLPALAIDAGPDPNAAATALVVTVAEAVAACLGESFEAWPPGRGGVLTASRWDDPFVSASVRDQEGAMFGPSVAVYAFSEAALADALAAEASSEVPELFSTYPPPALIEEVDRIVVRFQVQGGRSDG